MKPERKAQIAIIALRQKIRGTKIPYLNSKEMLMRIEKTLDLPELREIHVTREELEEFILELLSE